MFLHHDASISGSVNYLGFILDSLLVWREQLDVKMRKAHNLLCACRRACGVRWGLRPKVVYWLYFANVLPSISFASLVWRLGCQTPSAKKTLSRVQRLSCVGVKLWGCIGSLGVPGYEEMKSPTSSQGIVLFRISLDQSLSWGSRSRT